MTDHNYSRRAVLRMGAVAASAGLVAGAASFLPWSPRAHAATVAISLNAVGGNVPMVDGSNAFVFTYSGDSAPAFPAPTILCQEGDTVQVTLNNSLSIPVVFKLGDTGVRETVPAGGSRNFSFSAPAAGSYLYYDDQNGGVNRVLGLAGALICMPAGVTDRPFTGGPQFARQYKWMLHSIDPAWGNAVRNNHSAVSGIDPDSFMPRYFTVNGKSFPDTHHDHDSSLGGNYGEAAYVRMLNSGGMIHSPHFHGNHVQIITENGLRRAADNRPKKDIVSMFPLEVKDVLFPFEAPPDAWPAITSGQHHHYPMHDHCEPSQTAGGGGYPFGMHVAIHMGEPPAHEPHL